MFGARIVAVANTQGAEAAESAVSQGLSVARASEGPRRWWQGLFALGEGSEQPAVARSAAATFAANPVELRPRFAVRLDPARGIVE
jgi:hypothetical protein